ncbi:hypothetical protein C3R44_21510, partial [Mycobacterium tuberculosis]
RSARSHRPARRRAPASLRPAGAFPRPPRRRSAAPGPRSPRPASGPPAVAPAAPPPAGAAGGSAPRASAP